MLELRLERGYRNLYPYAAALVIEAVELDRKGSSQEAEILLDKARDLAPDFWGPSFAEAEMNMGGGRILNAFAPFVIGTRQKLDSINARPGMLFNVAGIGMKAFFLVALLFSLLLAARYLKNSAHDVTERFGRFTKPQAILLCAGTIALPIALAPHLIVYAFVVFMALWLYMSNRERAMAGIIALAMLGAPKLYSVMGGAMAGLQDPVLSAIAEVREGAWDATDTATLERAITEGRDPESTVNAKFSLATIYMYSGKIVEAEKLYTELIDASNLKFEATLMLGNLHFRAMRYDAALAKYEEACKLNSLAFECHYNKSAALSRPELVDQHAEYVEMSEKEQEIAKAISASRMDALTRYQGLFPGRLVEDARIPVGNLMDSLLADNARREQATASLFAFYSGGIPLVAAVPLILLAMMILGGLTWLSTRMGVAKSCDKCGANYCEKCQTQPVKGNVCVRCNNAFEQSAGMDPRMRERVRAEARLFVLKQVRIARIMSLVIPGAGHIYEGRPIRGVIFSFFAFLFWCLIGARGGALPSPWPNPASAVALPIAVAAILYIVLVAVATWNAGASKN